ncbi:hypothetical protein DFJ77DRAFT_458512 [Powellomyces hirtus]|nr:hypothetical protein DFJ77DRAFT_458512 [Powellomyces hirtus]
MPPDGPKAGDSTMSRPQTRVTTPKPPPAKVSSPTPTRRVLTITPAKKPATIPVLEPPVATDIATNNTVVDGKNATGRGKGRGSKTHDGKAAVVDQRSRHSDLSDATDKEQSKTTESFSTARLRKRRSQNKMDDADQSITPGPARAAAKPAVVAEPEPVAFVVEPEVEAIMSRKTKKRKEKKVPVKPRLQPETVEPPDPVIPPADPAVDDEVFPGALKERLEHLGVDFRKMSLDRPIAKPTADRDVAFQPAHGPPVPGPEPKKMAHGPPMPAPEPKKMAHGPPMPAPEPEKMEPAPSKPTPTKERKPNRTATGNRRSNASRKARANRRHSTEFDITSLFGGTNPATGEVDMQINTEVLANALSQLTAGYGYATYGGNPNDALAAKVNLRIDVQQGGSSQHPETTAMFDLSSLGINIGQLDQLAANLGHLPPDDHGPRHGPRHGQGHGVSQDVEGSVNVNVNGVPMSIDANAFIDQALEGLATTAAFLYEGLEAQAEKVRKEEEMKGQGKGKQKADSADTTDQTKCNIQRVAEQVSKLEEYAAKLQERVLGGAGPVVQAHAQSVTATTSRKSRKAAAHAVKNDPSSNNPTTFSVPGPPGQEANIYPSSSLSEMFGVGLQQGTANWTTEDWKAKCRSVEVVMKRVREARELRRRQKEGDLDTVEPASLAKVLNTSIVDAVAEGAMNTFEQDEGGADSEHEEACSVCMNNGELDPGDHGDDEHSVCSSGFATPSGDPDASAAEPNLFENNHIQRLLETVRLLVSSGEMLANTPSPAAIATCSALNTAIGNQGRRKKRKGVPRPEHAAHGASVGLCLQELDQQAGPFGVGVPPADGPGSTHDPIVFNPAPLLAAVANGSIAPGMPIPWEMFGLRGPPTAAAAAAATSPGAGNGDQSSEDSPGTPMDVRILERELEASRREERALEQQLVEVVRRNRQWQSGVADALASRKGHRHDNEHYDNEQHHDNEHHQHQDEHHDQHWHDQYQFDPQAPNPPHGCPHHHDENGVHVDQYGRPLGKEEEEEEDHYADHDDRDDDDEFGHDDEHGDEDEYGQFQDAIDFCSEDEHAPPLALPRPPPARLAAAAPTLEESAQRVLQDLYFSDHGDRHSMQSPTCSLD